MTTATLPTLTEDQIDDLLYLARIGESSDLKAGLGVFAKGLSTSPSIILAAAVDTSSGNGLLHMASANGHTNTLKALLDLSSATPSTPVSSLDLNLQNTSGNTPLHWAALNGRLEAVEVLVGAGADVTTINSAGHDAVYEAAVNEKNDVAEWLLMQGKGLERGVGGADASAGAEGEAEGSGGSGQGHGEEVEGEEGEEVTMRDGVIEEGG